MPMAKGVHISTMRAMLNSGDPCDLVLLTREGKVERWTDAISISYNVRTGTRKCRLQRSRQIRQCRDCLILQINSLNVYL